jgi:hypothetical protein
MLRALRAFRDALADEIRDEPAVVRTGVCLGLLLAALAVSAFAALVFYFIPLVAAAIGVLVAAAYLLQRALR